MVFGISPPKPLQMYKIFLILEKICPHFSDSIIFVDFF